MKPIIITTYNHHIDSRVPSYQSMVIDMVKGPALFMPVKYPYAQNEMLHADICNKYIHKAFYEVGADCILLLDVDCVPLSTKATELTFKLAYEGNLVGNIQRSNHYENDQHTYAAPSYMCFTRETYENAGSPTFSYNTKYDTGEIFTVNCTKNNIPVIKFMPTKVDAPFNDKGDYWDLADGMPKYGIGTTFSYNDMEMTYHLFSSRDHVFNKYFFNMCHSIITQ